MVGEMKDIVIGFGEGGYTCVVYFCLCRAFYLYRELVNERGDLKVWSVEVVQRYWFWSERVICRCVSCWG